ncbi:MAG: hypothetical protein ACXABX_01660 [Candidatus Thorarchaeota archaeon]
MVSLSRRNIAIVLMLAWLVLSPYALTTSNIGGAYNPIVRMELAAPTVTGPTLYEFENGTVGHTIVYEGSDPDPKNYTVTVEGDELDIGIWGGGDITVYLVWLYQGDWISTLPIDLTLVCTVFNNQDESASVTTTVRVIQDETAPLVDSAHIWGNETTSTTNITYEVGSFGHEILWNITEANPEFYNVTLISNEPVNNATELESGPWDGGDISFNIDGLNESRWYVFTLFLNDIFGLNTTSSVNVTVVPDTTYPTITNPDDISFEFGDESFEILWHAYDSNPKNYTVTGLILYNDTAYGNASEFHSFIDIIEPDWIFDEPQGGDVVIVVDTLFLGNYTITLTLYDMYDRMTNDSVNVTIYRDERAPVITPSGDLSYEEGYSGYSINWTIEESNPMLFNLTRDGEVYDNGTWHGEEYVLGVNDFPVGIYLYNMTYTDFFNQSDFSLIQVEVTADAHEPTVAEVSIFQTFSTVTTSNLTIHAYVWDLNNISSLEVQWGVGDPESVDFESETKNMEQSEIENIFTASLGEYKHGVVVWFKIIAQDDSSVELEFDTGWIAVEIEGQGLERVPAVLYAVVVIFGSLSILVILFLYFRTRTR